METIKNAIGMGAPAQTTGEEPVNAEQGAGTIAEPYDGGNKDENTPAVLDAAASTSHDVNAKGNPVDITSTTTGTTPSAIPETTPAAAAVVSDGAEPIDAKPTDAAGTSTETTKDAVAAPQAVGASTTKTVDDLGKTEATAQSPKTVETPAETKTTAQKEKAIGSAGWFKDTLQRRKSKGKPLETESEKGPKVPEKDTAPKKSASVGFVEPPKKKETPVTESKEKKEDTTVAKEKKKHKRGKSVSETLKSANPFKRRQSKAEKAEEKPVKAAVVTKEPTLSNDEPLTALPTVPGTTPTTAPAVKEKKAVDTAPASTITPVPVSKYADEEVAPDEIPGTAGRKNETAVEGSNIASPKAAETNSTPAALVAATAASAAIPKSEPAEVTPSAAEKSAAVEEPVANTTTTAAETGVTPTTAAETSVAPTTAAETTAAPTTSAETETSALADVSASATETPAATTTTAAETETPAVTTTTDPVTETPTAAASSSDKGKAVPAINEPAESAPMSNSAGKRPVVDEKPQGATQKGENLSAIPTAGGIRLGSRAMDERRASADVRRKSFVSEDVKPTEAAVKPSSSAEAAPTTKTDKTTETTEANHVAKDDVPKRRTSVFGKLKGKLKN